MIGRQFFNKIAATTAAVGMIVAIAADLAGAATALKNGAVNGFIRTNSPTFRFRDESRGGAPFQTAAGEEYVFNAQRGDVIQASVEVEDGSSLSPILVLTSTQTGAQVAYNNQTSSLRYQVPTAGEYRLLVLGQNNSRGRYTLSISGITQGTASQSLSTQSPSTQANDQKRQLLQNEYGLTVLDSCPTARGSLVVVSFLESNQTYTYCANPNRFVRAGEYTYDTTSGELKPGAPVAQTSSPQSTDPRRQLLQDEYGLRVLDNCPAARNSLVVVAFPEYGQTYTYCANPTRLVRAGQYTYDISSGELKLGTVAVQSPSSQTASTQTTDSRKQTLQTEYGLTVLDSCPPARNSLVVVSFPEGGQTYIYCANPNRVFQAGEYTYNATTRNLEAARKPAPPCTITLGGVCIIR